MDRINQMPFGEVVELALKSLTLKDELTTVSQELVGAKTALEDSKQKLSASEANLVKVSAERDGLATQIGKLKSKYVDWRKDLDQSFGIGSSVEQSFANVEDSGTEGSGEESGEESGESESEGEADTSTIKKRKRDVSTSSQNLDRSRSLDRSKRRDRSARSRSTSGNSDRSTSRPVSVQSSSRPSGSKTIVAATYKHSKETRKFTSLPELETIEGEDWERYKSSKGGIRFRCLRCKVVGKEKTFALKNGFNKHFRPHHQPPPDPLTLQQ